ncbi:MAG: sigma factor-like helix-turn-helix DNA-binding protein [Candidatus Riflemargulisbacteria bacterium]
MKTKDKERKEAIRMRGEGCSVKEIARMLGVSSASVSVWVRHVLLTDEQKVILCNRSPHGDEMKKVWEVHQRNALDKRMECQKKGRKMMKTASSNFIAGCMLYWAEGSKGKNSVVFVNSDVEMMKFFVGFIRKHFGITNDEIIVSLKFYSGNGISFEDAILYWLKELSLDCSSVRKSQIDVIRKDGYGKKSGKLPYGICRVAVNRTDVTQMIFGAIQEYVGFDNEAWLGRK